MSSDAEAKAIIAEWKVICADMNAQSERRVREKMSDRFPRNTRGGDQKSIWCRWSRWISAIWTLVEWKQEMTDEVKNIGDLNAVITVVGTEVTALIEKLDEALAKLADNPDVSNDIAAAKDRIAAMAQTIQDKLNPPAPADPSGNVEGA